MSGGYEKAIRDSIPDAEIAFDPFHVVRLAQRAVDQVRRDEWNAHERSHTPQGKWIKGTRWSLLKAPAGPDSVARRIVPEALDLTGALDAELWASRLLGAFWSQRATLRFNDALKVQLLRPFHPFPKGPARGLPVNNMVSELAQHRVLVAFDTDPEIGRF